jgi:phosphoserine phosphatase
MRPEAADDNAARWWTYAQARGEQAAAEAARGRAAIAAGHARDALAAWRRATPDGAPPGALARWADRDRLLAAASAT